MKESKKTIRVFSLASFLNDLGAEMIYPVWPFFVTSVLGANMVFLGFLDGLGEMVSSFSRAGSGYLSDRFRKRRIFIWLGYIFGSISRIGYALSTMPYHLIPFTILEKFGKIREAPRDATIADVSTRKDRGSAFGFLRTMDNLGAVFGITICILFFSYLGYQKLFYLAAIPSLISVLLVLIFIKEKNVNGVYKRLSFNQLTNNLKLFFFVSILFAMGSFSYSFLLIFASNFGFEVSSIPVLYLIFTLTVAIMSLPFGKLADNFNRRLIIIISYTFFGLMCIGFILLKTRIGIILLFILYGLHKAALEPVKRTFISELSPIEFRASMLGTFQMTIGLCALPASLIAGLLWEFIGIYAPFYFSLGLTALSIILMMFVKE